MSFEFNRFLANKNKNTDARIDDLEAGVYYKDGREQLEGAMSVNNNLIIGPKAVEFIEQKAGQSPNSNHIALYAKTDKKLYYQDDAKVEHEIHTSAGSGVGGPLISTDNAIPRWNGTAGDVIQDSNVIISDVDAVSGITQLNVDNLRLDGNTLSSTSLNGIINLIPNGSGDLNIDCTAGGNFISNSSLFGIAGAIGSSLSTATGDLNLQATSGSIIVQGGQAATDAVRINASNAAGGIDIDAGTNGIDVDSTGTIDLASTTASANAIRLFSSLSNIRIEGETGLTLDVNSGNLDFTVSGAVIISNGTYISVEKPIRFIETGVGSNYTAISAPASIGASYTLTLPPDDGNPNDLLISDGAGVLSFSSSSGLSLVTGPALSVDNAIVRFDGTTGKVIQDGVLTIDDDGWVAISGTSYLHARGTLNNQFLGAFSGNSASICSNNTGIGKNALKALVGTNDNTALGFDSLLLSVGSRNTSVGSGCLDAITTGNDNIAIGYNSGSSLLASDSNNILIGNVGTVALNNSIRIGNATHTTCLIDSIWQTAISSAEQVVIDSTGKLGSQELNPLPKGYIHGFNCLYNTASTVVMGTAGEDSVCRDADDTVNITINGLRTVSLATTGLNGRSVTYSETTHTSYDVYAVNSTSGGLSTGYLIIESGDDVTQTTEFKTNGDWDTYRRVAWFRNGLDTADASDIIPFIAGGLANDREFYFSPLVRADVLILNGGTSTVWSTCVDLAPVGGSGERSTFNMTATGSYFTYLRTAFGDTGSTTTANASAALRPQGNTTTDESTSVWTISPGIPLGSGEFQDNDIQIPINPANRTLQYIQSTAGDELYLYIIGFKYSL